MSKLVFVDGHNLNKVPKLADTMFLDRAHQFSVRLKWPAVCIDRAGHEHDNYDDDDSVYVIWQLEDGSHGASLRLRPLYLPNMLEDHFGHLLALEDRVRLRAWECTRFLVSPRSGRDAGRGIALGLAQVLRESQISAILGVFDRKMLRVYRSLRASPKILAMSETRDWLAVGQWNYSEGGWAELVRRTWLSESDVCKYYRDRQFMTVTEARLHGEGKKSEIGNWKPAQDRASHPKIELEIAA